MMKYKIYSVLVTVFLGAIFLLVLSFVAGLIFIFIAQATGNQFLVSNTVFFYISMVLFALLSAWLSWLICGKRIWNKCIRNTTKK